MPGCTKLAVSYWLIFLNLGKLLSKNKLTIVKLSSINFNSVTH